MQRFGALLVFMPGTTREQAEAELAKLDTTTLANLPQKRDGEHVMLVEEFDDQYGGPVWYIP